MCYVLLETVNSKAYISRFRIYKPAQKDLLLHLMLRVIKTLKGEIQSLSDGLQVVEVYRI